MNIFESLFLGAAQGITEFLPISSSGHLVIIEEMMGLEVESLLEFDILLHLGTLFSILVYFRKDIWNLFKLLPKWVVAVYSFLKSGFKDKEIFRGDFFIISALFIATIPAGIVGVLFEDLISEVFRSSESVGLMMLFTAGLFVVAERFYEKRKNAESSNSLWKPLIIGLMQALALIPGVSRSGSTISAGLITGMKRDEAARFSFFLGSIAIFGAAVLTFKDLSFDKEWTANFSVLASGFLSAFVFGVLSIGFLMKFLKKHPLSYFSIYLVIASGLLLFVL